MKADEQQPEVGADSPSATAAIDRLAAHAVTGDTFEESVLQADADTVVIVFFWAPWCEPCRTVAPLVLRAAAAHEGRVVLATVNTDDEEKLARQQSVAALPTTVLFKHGEALERFAGKSGDIDTGFSPKDFLGAIDAAIGPT